MNFASISKKLAILFLGLSSACSPTDFPHAPASNGLRDVPFVDTFNFGFKTGGLPVRTPQGNLAIISATDSINLLNAANIPVKTNTGVISGIVVNTFATPVPNVTIVATDRDGNPVGDLFYNSFAAIPDFEQFTGTADNGGFTIFNVPPGEVYLKATSGGRGNTRLVTFANSVSNVAMVVVSVPYVPIDSVAEVKEVNKNVPSSPINIYLQGGSGGIDPRVPLATTDSTGSAKLTTRSEGSYLVKLSGSGYVDTYNVMTTYESGLIQNNVPVQSGFGVATAGIPQLPVLTQFFWILSASDKAMLSAGITLDPANRGILVGAARLSDGSYQPNTVIQCTNSLGNPVGQVVYLDFSGHPDPSLQGTSLGGRYIVFNLPPGPVFVRATAQVLNGGPLDHFSEAQTVYIFQDSATFQDLTLTTIDPTPGTAFAPTCYPLSVSGKVTQVNETTPLKGVQVSPVGVAEFTNSYAMTPTTSSSTDGTYQFSVPYGTPLPSPPAPLPPECTLSVPLIAFGNYWMQVSPSTTNSAVYASYQQVILTQYAQTNINLIGLDTGHTDYFPFSSGTFQRLGPGIVTGVISDKTIGKTAEGVSISVTDLSTGKAVGKVCYFNLDGSLSCGTQSTKDGRYIVYDLPVDNPYTYAEPYQITITSAEDTGDIITVVFPNGVTFQNLQVNHYTTRTVPASGNIADFITGDPLGGASLQVLGKDLTYNTAPINLSAGVNSFIPPPTIPFSPTYDGKGSFAGILSSNGTFTFQSIGAGLVNAYNFFVNSLLKETKNMAVYGLQSTSLTTLERQVNFNHDPTQGVILGRAITPGFAPFSSLSSAFTDSNRNPVQLTNPTGIVTGYFNEDDILDVAVIDNKGANQDQILIFYGRGDGTFLLGQTLQGTTDATQCLAGAIKCFVGSGPVSLLAVDLNKDNQLDLVVVNQSSSSVAILLGSRKGVFSFNQSIAVGNGPATVSAGDFNLDGFIDLVVGNHDDNTLSFLLNNKNATFALNSSLSIPDSPLFISTAEIDGDNLLDVIAVTQKSLLVVRGVGLAHPGTETYNFPSGMMPISLVIGDLLQNGTIDVGVLDGSTGQSTSGNILIYLRNKPVKDIKGNTVDTIFTDPFTAAQKAEYPASCVNGNNTPPGQATYAGLADINQDGVPDLVIAYKNNTVGVFLGVGDGTFYCPFYYQMGGPVDFFALGDTDGNNLTDLIGVSANSGIVAKGENIPLAGVKIKAQMVLDNTSQGSVFYFGDGTSVPVTQIDPTLQATSSSGKFAILNVPPGLVQLVAQGFAVGSESIIAYPNSASILDFLVHPFSVQTVPVSGFVFDAVNIPIGHATVEFLGTGVSAVTGPVTITDLAASDTGGDYYVTLPAYGSYIARLRRPL